MPWTYFFFQITISPYLIIKCEIPAIIRKTIIPNIPTQENIDNRAEYRISYPIIFLLSLIKKSKIKRKIKHKKHPNKYILILILII